MNVPRASPQVVALVILADLAAVGLAVVAEHRKNRGRVLTVKFADSEKNEFGLAQLPAAMVPVSTAFPAGYPKPVTGPVVWTVPVGYSAYQQDQTLSSSHPVYANAAAQYAQQSQVSYGSIAGKNPQLMLPAGSSTGVGTFPFHAGQQ